jgi:hypothetical protein
LPDSAPCAVDHAHALFHQRERSRAHDAAGFVGKRRVHGDKIGAPEQLFQSDQFDAGLGRGIGGQDRIEANHLHLQAERAIRNDSADIAEAYDPERFVANLDAGEFSPLPFARAQGGVGGGDMPRQRHHQGNRMLRRGHAVAERTVHHDDAAPRSSVEIDVVDADAGASDHAERFRGVDHFRRDPRRAADHERMVGRDYLREFGRLKARLHIDGEAGMALEDF